ncbi:MAG TPA: carboxymuconolactone decarboxylase family protein [Candidatus Krumholzibacteria bacterium]|nr:carboxymuconolactone decarboxylase family protein [Candidatus Krumholzibacteria bacterium]HPD70848.1 carboxymuconolactone decarboxylase family protein [Candidatus Krumholzibacteria bacterium]HRY39452.1 carboxymuconolactone decarboxylase family protein [Candidatus Krumholzibacteria bacterium]
MGRLEEFRAYREKMNARLLETGTQTTQRFFNLDAATFRHGALDARTKELLGLVASLVLRCDDCVTYHVVRALEEGAGEAAIMETFDIGLLVGGSIVIPHVRRGRELLDELLASAG